MNIEKAKILMLNIRDLSYKFFVNNKKKRTEFTNVTEKSVMKKH